ncbi:restriction endonuclease [Paenibacillus cymbidii]|uniref:restriction endonuclease n=1 Tax=Paenibacillus cymbidii TaxID=1639034 RepID=UPI001082287D|nr:restriction endonuclease [Paenibacillus cymbidii]
MNIIYHYPPELLNLLVDTIPILNRSKKDIIVFFRGAGVSESILRDMANAVQFNRESINKYEIVRNVLSRLNELGEVTLRERREVLKRVIEFESFEACWDSDRLKAKGLVHEVRQIVNVKDSFTRMKQEKEKVELKNREEYLKRIEESQKLARAKELFKDEISTLFFMKDPHKRGKLFEDVLNRLFNSFGILVKESFTLTGDSKEGIVEQIDGVIELDGDYYLVEMKWWGQAVGPDEIGKHLVRIFTRGQARGLFISVSGFTDPVITTCKQALDKVVIVLCDLQEIISMFEDKGDLKKFLKEKIQAAIIDRNPYHR